MTIPLNMLIYTQTSKIIFNLSNSEDYGNYSNYSELDMLKFVRLKHVRGHPRIHFSKPCKEHQRWRRPLINGYSKEDREVS